MTDPPALLSGIPVTLVLAIGTAANQLPTATLEVAGAYFAYPEHMAICCDADGAFLFYCNAEWGIWNDLYFESLRDAIDFVEQHEYANSADQWRTLA